jgi:hypothetical protein
VTRRHAVIGAGFLAACAAIAISLWLGTVFGAHTSGTASDHVMSPLRAKREQCRQDAAQLGLLGADETDSQNMTVEKFDEGEWDDFDQDDKVRQAQLLFCAKMPDSGHYTVLIQGRHSGKTLARVVDGNYADDQDPPP